jgi:hypothetical protein
MIKLKIQLNDFTDEYDLPLTLGKRNSDNYFIMRDNITGLLSNNHYRLVIAREIEIANVEINERNCLEAEQTNNLIIRCLNIDFNSLYQNIFHLQ